MIEKFILIGASTGGPGHLKKILESLPEDFTTPIVIAQHMNRIFIPTFVSQFNSDLVFDVKEVFEGLEIKIRHIYICRKNTVIQKRNGFFYFQEIDEKSLYNPSIDLLFNSAVNFAKELNIMAVLLTGIGNDGAKGLDMLYKKGAFCVAESEESAIVYGMPKKAVELNSEIVSKNLRNIIEEIKRFDKNYRGNR